MEVIRNYPCNYNGKVYGAGEPVDVPEEIGKRWVESGASVMPEGKQEKPDADAEAKAEVERVAGIEDEARKMAVAEAGKRGMAEAPEFFYTHDLFKSLEWVPAQKVAKDLYDVQDNSWVKLWKEFSEAQEKAWKVES